MVSKSQRRFRIAILIVGTFTFLCYLIFPGWARHALKRDHDDAPPQRGVATVVLVVPPSNNPFLGVPEPERVMVRFRGKLQDAREVHDFQKLQVGGAAQITYRVGRSRHVYIDSVEPLKTVGQ